MFSDKPLIVYEMANNHMGDLAHGKAIIDAFAEVSQPFRGSFDFAFKLQYRDLDTFIHPAHRAGLAVKHVKRFLETRLDEAAFLALREHMRARSFLAVCTPFDEVSVARIERHGYDAIKIASCSFGDWPLMEAIGRARLPVIASTAGAGLDLIDRVVSFLEHRGRPLTLLHCVGEYPTPPERMQLDQLDLLRGRYPQVQVGFSTHEAPDDVDLVRMAVAKGARVLEKHVGLPTPAWPLNAYSASPAQIARWLAAATQAATACGVHGARCPSPAAEQESLHGLRRGVFARGALAAGTVLGQGQVLLAMPAVPGQLTANDLGKYIEYRLRAPLADLAPVMADQVERHDHRQHVSEIVNRVRTLLRDGHVVVSEKAEVEISHHYGIDRFEQVGCVILSIVNRAYCKKIIAVLPGQSHPEQHHRQKEETFHLLHGDLELVLDGRSQALKPGEIVTVERGMKHAFSSRNGAVIEEISSTHYVNDSFYTDPAIAANGQRKTQLTYFFG